MMMLGGRTGPDSGLAPDSLAHRVEQDRSDLALALQLDFDALFLEGADQPVDQPRAGGIHLLDVGKIERQGLETAAFLDLAHVGVDQATVRVVQMPENAQPRTPPSSPTATRGWWSASQAVVPLASRLPMVNMASCLA